MHCSLLAEDAIKSAIKDYQTKREKRLAMAVSFHSHLHPSDRITMARTSYVQSEETAWSSTIVSGIGMLMC